MSTPGDGGRETGVLQSKRRATRYQILVEIAERQPAVSQQEIADAVGITAQAVSDYVRDLVEQGFVEKHGRGRYEVTKEGVDWLISQTEELRHFVEHVSADVIGEVEIVTAIAATPIEEGETVSLVMRDGVQHAIAGDTGSATAVAVTDAAEGQDVGVTNVTGIVEFDPGVVTILTVPPVRDGGSSVVNSSVVADRAQTHDLLAAAGTESLAAARAADLEPDVRFGTAPAVQEAARKGLDVLLLVSESALSAHTDRLREGPVNYEVLDAAEE